jgi:short-subunit dehydrogenase
MFEYRGKTALITGASYGIGAVFVDALAQRGMNVILVARSEEAMKVVAQAAADKHKVRTEVIVADLSKEGAVELVKSEVERRGLSVDLLVNNAGFATHGYFESIPAERERDEIIVNIAALVGMTHAFIGGMLKRGGAVINVASNAAFQPIPYMAVYAATKAFVVSFSRALSIEFAGRNVQVQALCPGPTATKFFETADAKEAAVGKLRTSEDVVATSLRALDRSRPLAVDGLFNRVQGFFAGLTPAAMSARIAGNLVKPRRDGSADASKRPTS